jgi:ATP-dependent Clp protease ATP-binding subunit ClpB
VILTSNIGTSELTLLEERRDLSDEDRVEQSRQVAMDALRHHFRPEFINRLDEIVVYQRLAREHLRRIVDIQLGSLAERLRARELGLELTDAAKDFLAEVGWDPQFGARPLKRAIQKHLEDVLARRVLAGEYIPGETIIVDRQSGELTFTHRAPIPANGAGTTGTTRAAAE